MYNTQFRVQLKYFGIAKLSELRQTVIGVVNHEPTEMYGSEMLFHLEDLTVERASEIMRKVWEIEFVRTVEFRRCV